MRRCTNHPATETAHGCLKHDVYMCEECLKCRDPEIYCKFRSACAIHFLTKRKGNLDDESPSEPRNEAVSTGSAGEKPGRKEKICKP